MTSEEQANEPIQNDTPAPSSNGTVAAPVAPAAASEATTQPEAAAPAVPPAEPAVRREITRHRFEEANGNRELVIQVLDDPGARGACHHYRICGYDVTSNPSLPGGDVALAPVGDLLFQNGPITEVGGANGITQEALLAIVEDRLLAFQKGRHACEENQNALIHLQHSLAWLKKRTERRLAAGTEGTHEGS